MVDEGTIADLQAYLRTRLSDDYLRDTVPPHLLEQRNRLHDLLQRTVQSGEGNSVLLIGPRGSGKSFILHHALHALRASSLARAPNGELPYIEVRLNGLLHTDDRLALDAIARQLCAETDVEKYARASFAETLAHLLGVFRRGNKESKAVTFLLDEFDLFASHPRQTLLYNLFDICQSPQTPIAVVGVTCRLDAVELLEKRVKSRFSHRQIHCFCTYSFDEYVAMLRDVLVLGADFPHRAFAEEWNAKIATFVADSSVLTLLRSQYDLDKTIRTLYDLAMTALWRISPSSPFLEHAFMYEGHHAQSLDEKAALLQGVSVLELCLIVAMGRVAERFEGEPFNFAMVYEEYKAFATGNTRTVDFFSKPVAMKAFEHLSDLEFVCPADGAHSSAGIPREYRMVRLLLEPPQIVEAVTKFPDCPTTLRQWGTQWLE